MEMSIGFRDMYLNVLIIERCARVVDRGLLAAYLVLEVSSAKERMISHLSDVDLSITIPVVRYRSHLPTWDEMCERESTVCEGHVRRRPACRQARARARPAVGPHVP